MQPIGNHVFIKPIPQEGSDFLLLEPDPVQKAEVKAVSPDISVPFRPGDTIVYPLGGYVSLFGKAIINTERILAWKSREE